eukprot:619247-Alexandrium_andersonii.AAC.1
MEFASEAHPPDIRKLTLDRPLRKHPPAIRTHIRPTPARSAMHPGTNPRAHVCSACANAVRWPTALGIIKEWP